MSDITKYSANDPLFDEVHLENLYKDNYKEFHNLSNYFKDLDINIYNDKFLPIIVKKSVFIKLSDKFDKFEKSFTAELRDNKIEFSREWSMDLQVKIYESDKRIRLDIHSHYKGTLNYLKFNKQRGMAIKINDNVTFFDAFYVGRGSIGGGQYLVTGVFEIDLHILRNIINSKNAEIRFSTEAGNFDFTLTLATTYGLQKFYDKYITAIEENLNRE